MKPPIPTLHTCIGTPMSTAERVQYDATRVQLHGRWAVLNGRKWVLIRSDSETRLTPICGVTIDYAISIRGCTSKQNIYKIQRLQNRAARIITGNYDFINTRGIDLVKNLKWMCVSQRRDYFIAILMFKSIYCLAPHYL